MNLKDKLTLTDERDQADIKAIKRDFSHMLRSPLSWWMAGLSVGAFILLWLLNGTAETLGISPDLARDLGLVIVLVMLPFGLRPNPLGALAGIALLAIFGVGLGSLSYALALAVRKQDWMFWVVQQALLYPLMILSGMLLPLATGPSWMRAAAHANPLTYVVDAERALFAGDVTSTVGWGVLAAAVFSCAWIASVVRWVPLPEGEAPAPVEIGPADISIVDVVEADDDLRTL